MYPRYLFGSADCKRKPDYKYDMSIQGIQLIPNQFVGIKELYFPDIGFYFFRIVAKSDVSTHTEQFVMNIIDAPCYPPSVSTCLVIRLSMEGGGAVQVMGC